MAGFLGRPWWKRRSPEANSGAGAAAQLEEGKNQPGEGNDQGHGKRADGKCLVAPRTATGNAGRGLQDVGQQQDGG